MPRGWMVRLAVMGWVGLSGVGLTACVGNPGVSTIGTGGSGAVGTGSGGTGAPGSGGASSGGATGFTLECPKANLGSPLERLLTRTELEATLVDIFPEVKGQWSGSLPASNLSAYGFDNDGSAEVGKQLAGALVDTALSVATALTGTPLATILPCSTSAADRACADTFLTKYGKRLFRRPVTQAERDRYLTFFDATKTKSDFKTALKYMIAGVIQSPNTLYRSEVGAVQGDGTRQLTPHEVATALAYTYSGTAPSEALLAKADAGDLGDVLATAKTMMASEPGKQMMQRFFEGYLAYTSVSAIARPNVPNFSNVGGHMAQETRAFIDDVVLKKGGGIKELLTASTTNPSAALATFYAFPAPGGDYAPVTRPASRGIGVLSQGSFLTTHASATGSSPTKRGLFVYERLLCEPRLSVPDNVPTISDPMPGQKTTRQRYEELHAKPGTGCAGCHVRFDPIGFGFEHFDEGGRYRESESGLAINSTGSASKAGTPLFMFNGQEELARGLAEQPVVAQCVAAHMATFAYGSNEACTGASQVAALQAGTIGLAEAYARLATEPHFTKRNAQ